KFSMMPQKAQKQAANVESATANHPRMRRNRGTIGPSLGKRCELRPNDHAQQRRPPLRARHRAERKPAAAVYRDDWFGILRSRRVLSRRLAHDWHVELTRRYMPFLPVGERERYLGVALACLIGDPHGAVELVPSAATRQRHFDLRRRLPRALRRELD